MNPKSLSLIHRFGDEILLVAREFQTAYLIAFYVMATWPFSEQPPYFGVGYGNLATEFPDSEELEMWNSPVAKMARRSADKLKSTKDTYRQWLLFDEEDEINRGVNEVLNEYALIQDRFFKLQTQAEHLASALYTLHDLQEWIANRLNKNRSTISRQLRKSNVEMLLTIKNRIVQNLSNVQLQQSTQNSKRLIDVQAGDLETQIKQLLMDRVHTMLDLMVERDN